MTHYEILGISENASLEEIKTAYRKSALEYHPDVNKSPNASQIFVLIQKAYKVLSNPNMRTLYNSELLKARMKNFEDIPRQNHTQSSNQNYQNNNTQRERKNDEKRQKRRYMDTIVPELFFVSLVSFIFIIIIVVHFTNKNNTDIDNQYQSVSPPIDDLTMEKVLREFVDTYNDPRSKGDINRVMQLFPEFKGYNPNLLEEFVNTYNDPRSKGDINRVMQLFPEFTGKNPNKGTTHVQLEDKPQFINIRPNTGDSPYKSYFGVGMKDFESLSEITVQNGTNQDVVVIFINVYSDKCMRNAYIRANSNYTIKQIPEGTYKMKCNYGNDWDSSLNNGSGFPVGGFRRNVSFTTPSSSRDYFDMHREETYDGYNYPTYTVSLHKVRNGNMHTKNISKSDFFN